MSVLGHDAVRWDGRKIVGGSPLWIRIAVRKPPLTDGAIMRVGERVHVFVGTRGVQIADPGDWILHERKSGALLVQTNERMASLWEWRDGGFYRRPQPELQEYLRGEKT